MKLFCSLLLMLIFILPAFGEYAFQITVERNTAGECVNWRDISADVAFELEPDSTARRTYPSAPDGTAVDDDDNQEWFVANTDNTGYYLVSFSFAGVGLSILLSKKTMEYWFRYSKDGILFGESSSVVVMKPHKPIKK